MYYKIADCFVKYEPNYMYMQKKIKPYEERFHGESENSCIYLGYKSDAYYKKKQKMHPEITCEKLEYVYVGAEFNRKILKYGGIMIHSSAVEVDGKAYLFSAPCGTGKSTHTKQWQKYFGADQAIIINDDKTINQNRTVMVRLIDIAREANVTVPVVSTVLNERYGKKGTIREKPSGSGNTSQVTARR